MANSYNTTLKVLSKIHAHFTANTAFIPSVRNKYENEFAVPGDKVGSVIQIKRENTFVSSSSQVLAPTPVVEASDNLVLDTWNQVSVDNADLDLVLSINDKNDQFIISMANQMAENMEAAHINKAIMGTHFTQGTVGVSPTTLAAYGTCRGILTKVKTPEANRQLALTVDTVNALIGGQLTQYNPQREIEQEYRKGTLGAMAGFDVPFESALIQSVGVGTRTATTFAITDYTATTLTISGGAAQAGLTIAAGETATINSAYIVTNNVAQSTNFQFVNNETIVLDASGNGVLTSVSPSIVISGNKQTISATPVGKTLTLYGSASSNNFWSLAYHPKAFSFASVKLTIPKSAEIAQVMNKKGVQFRLWNASDIVNNRFPLRLDSLSGLAVHHVPFYVPAVRIACAG